ncbi:MAG TPA: hypothetical protein VN445_01715 [Rectinemataceae bacterium]|nr:hypothetical protein [Rectinemataceae bacterium]
MANRVRRFTERKRGNIAWMAALAVLIYIIFAQRSLKQEERIVRLESLPARPAAIATKAGYMNTAQGRAFVVRSDQQGIMETDKAGRPLWTHEFGTVLTTTSSSASLSAWGLLNGSVQVLDEEGQLLDEIKPVEDAITSTYPCVYSVAISENGKSVAALYGLDPQYFLVYAKSDRGYGLVFEKKLERQVLRGQQSAFSRDGNSVICHTADGLALYDVKQKKGVIIRADYFADGTELLMEPIGPDSFALLAARGNESFAGLMRNGSIEAMFPIDEGSSSLIVSGDVMTIEGRNVTQRYKVVSP